MNSNFVPNLTQNQQDLTDNDFNILGGEIYASFSPWASWLGNRNPFAPLAIPSFLSLAAVSGAATSQIDPGSVVAVTAGGITINLLFDAAAMAAPAGFRAGIQQAVSIMAAAISDKITVNIKIDYSGTGGGASAGPDHGTFQSYSSVRANLINNATPGDTTFNALTAGSSIQGQSNVAVWNAQLKLWGLMAANDTGTDDGAATFATDINPNLLVGVALHELTHAMGRIPYGPQPDIFDLFRFTGVGTQLFKSGATAPAAYFSLDGGNTKLADYGRTSDASDFLNSGVQGSNDPFNEFYNGSTAQHLTAADLKQLDALGFHLLTADTASPVAIHNGSITLAAGGTAVIASSLLQFDDNVSSHAQETYSVIAAPAHGTLLKNGAVTTSFTQADLDNGLIAYHETASGVTSDNFYFRVTDAAGNMSGITPFQINMDDGINHAPVGDVNGDGKSDILWRSDTGTVVSWNINDSHVLSTSDFGPTPNNWKIAGTGDFNGDHRTDLLWRSDAGTVATWDISDNRVLSTNDFGVVPNNWKVAGTGDFNGDGKSDFLLHSDGGTLVTWDIDDGHVLRTNDFGIMPSNWKIAGIGDFNGDGKSDLLLRSDVGTVVTWDMNDGQVTSTNLISTIPADWQIAGTGDFNGDGKSDILLRSDAGTVVTWDMNDGQVTSTNVISSSPANWHVASTGDYNGDGKADILWRSDAGTVVSWDMNDAHVTSTNVIAQSPTDWHII